MRAASLVCTIAIGSVQPCGAQDPSGASPPRFSIDHVGCAVDDATFEAVGGSDFLKEELAHARPGGARTAAGASWTNFVVWGELTYLEFLPRDVAEQLGLDAGVCFVALHSDEPGAVEWLSEEMARRHPESNPRVGPRELMRGEVAIPWYDSVVFHYEDGPAGFGVWAKTRPEAPTGRRQPARRRARAPAAPDRGPLLADRAGTLGARRGVGMAR